MDSLFTTFLFLSGFAIICGTFTFYIKKGIHKQQSTWERFQRRDHEADFITKREFPYWLLLTFEKDKIPYVSNSSCENYFSKVMAFENKSMVDLSPYTNLELKEKFGINFFSQLVQYEETFFAYIETLYQYALSLEKENYLLESKLLLEYMIGKNWASQKCTTTLNRIYDTMNKIDKSENLN